MLPIVQAMGEAVPLAGSVIKAVAGGLLHLLRTVNVILHLLSMPVSVHERTIYSDAARTRKNWIIWYRN